MQPKYISYHQTNAFSSVVLDYIDGKDNLESFYRFSPSIQGIKEAIQNRRFNGDRSLLVSVLRRQYGEVTSTPEVLQNISLLADERTFTITTGHQLNIFTGPLYFIYKIVTAIKLAADLKKEFPEYNFVPVYWMATEDHDFEEINHVEVEDKKISWETKAAGATGRLDPAGIAEALLAYKGFLGISDNGQAFAALVEKAYTAHHSLSGATRELVDALFGKKGLVCIDADETALKAQFAPIIYKDITEQHSFKQIGESNILLEEQGYKPQVNPREINFFYMRDGLRERITMENGQYKVLHTMITFNKEELRKEIDHHPDRFSPNVVMRPLYQEIILPNLAYIGGGAELTYWLQLKANFDQYQVFYPVLILRNSALIIDDRSARKMQILDISAVNLFQSDEQLKSLWIKAHVGDTLCLDDEERAIRAVFDQIKLNSFKIDKTLALSAEAAKTKALKLVNSLEKKLLRAEKRKHTTSLLQIENLKNKLFPKGVLQERVLNIAPMYIFYGDSFIEELFMAFRPLDQLFTVIYA